MPRTDGLIRALTPGERAIAVSVFGDALDTGAVRLRCAKWSMFQPAWITMAPDGDVWFHPNSGLWRDDFSFSGLGIRTLLVHELTHAWQHQCGTDLVWRRLPFSRYGYLPLVPGKPFEAYGIEQQASIVEDWYWLREGGEIIGAPGFDCYRQLIPFAPG